MQWNVYFIAIVSKSMKTQENELISYSFFAENKHIFTNHQNPFPFLFLSLSQMLIQLSFDREARRTASIIFLFCNESESSNN